MRTRQAWTERRLPRFKRVGPNAMRGRGIGTARGRATIMRGASQRVDSSHDQLFTDSLHSEWFVSVFGSCELWARRTDGRHTQPDERAEGRQEEAEGSGVNGRESRGSVSVLLLLTLPVCAPLSRRCCPESHDHSKHGSFLLTLPQHRKNVLVPSCRNSARVSCLQLLLPRSYATGPRIPGRVCPWRVTHALDVRRSSRLRAHPCGSVMMTITGLWGRASSLLQPRTFPACVPQLLTPRSPARSLD